VHIIIVLFTLGINNPEGLKNYATPRKEGGMAIIVVVIIIINLYS